MTAEIISVGTELLLGDIVNTNAAFLARELAKLGISGFTQTVVGDNPKRLMRAYQQAYERGADLIIAGGGLGPTEDDITKEIAAEYFNLPLELHEPSWEAMQRLFAKIHPHIPIVTSNKKQAMLPKGCVVFPNNNGTAPGLYLEVNGKMMILLPGPPSELEPMFLEQAVPFLRKKTNSVLVSKVLKVAGIGESMVEQMVKPLIDEQDNPTIAPYAKLAEVWLRVTASAPSEEEAKKMIEPVSLKLRDILGDAIYGEDDDTFESVICQLLKERGFKLALAESCTGGMITSKLVNHPGISEVLHEAVICYSNESKTERLGVDAQLIKKYGAVSAEVVAAMAEGAAKSTDNCVGLSTTGVAGPGGGTPDKPVGMVFLGLHIPGKGNFTKELTLTGKRERIRTRAVVSALDFLRLSLMEEI